MWYDHELIIDHLFGFFGIFIIASAGVANNLCFILSQQKTCNICGFTDEEGREQYQAKCFKQNAKDNG